VRARRNSGRHKILGSLYEWAGSPACWSGVVRLAWNWKCWHEIGIHGRARLSCGFWASAAELLKMAREGDCVRSLSYLIQAHVSEFQPKSFIPAILHVCLFDLLLCPPVRYHSNKKQRPHCMSVQCWRQGVVGMWGIRASISMYR